MATIVRVEGFKELAAALEQLPKQTARSVLTRVLLKAAAPTHEAAKAKAPVETGKLQRSVVVGKQLTRRQKADARKEGVQFAEVHVGTASGHGIPQEFGTAFHPAQPFMRPAWDANKVGALSTIKTELGTQIEKSAKRLANKAAKLAAKG